MLVMKKERIEKFICIKNTNDNVVFAGNVGDIKEFNMELFDDDEYIEERDSCWLPYSKIGEIKYSSLRVKKEIILKDVDNSYYEDCDFIYVINKNGYDYYAIINHYLNYTEEFYYEIKKMDILNSNDNYVILTYTDGFSKCLYFEEYEKLLESLFREHQINSVLY
jgi:hypothetical protein